MAVITRKYHSAAMPVGERTNPTIGGIRYNALINGKKVWDEYEPMPSPPAPPIQIINAMLLTIEAPTDNFEVKLPAGYPGYTTFAIDWLISWGDGTTNRYQVATGISNTNRANVANWPTHTYASAGFYQVRIEDGSGENRVQGWLQGFCNNMSTSIDVSTHDLSYIKSFDNVPTAAFGVDTIHKNIGLAMFAGTGITAPATYAYTGNWFPNLTPINNTYFKAYQYFNCLSLLYPEDSSIDLYYFVDSSVTANLNYYKYHQYDNCISLLMPAVEQELITETLTLNYLYYAQYFCCSSLTTPAEEVVPFGTTSITYWNAYRGFQYCRSGVITAAAENYTNFSNKMGLSAFRTNQYDTCTSLLIAAEEQYEGVDIKQYSNYRSAQYAQCASLLAVSPERNTVLNSKIGTGYRQELYRDCPQIIAAASEFNFNTFSTLNWELGNNFRRRQYENCILLGNAPNEVFEPTVIAAIPMEYFRAAQFKNCTSLTTLGTVKGIIYTGSSGVVLFNFYRSEQYSGCISLLIGVNRHVQILQVGSIGTNFREKQYYRCSALQSCEDLEENLNYVLSVGANFRWGQYYECTSLNSVSTIEGFSDSVISIGSHFRAYQFYGCTSLTQVVSESFSSSSSLTTIPTNFRCYQYYGCSSLNSASSEVFNDNVVSIGSGFREYSYALTGILQTPTEVLSNSLLEVGYSFRNYQYRECTKLISTPSIEVIPNSVTTIGYAFRRGQYYGCSALTGAALQEVLPSSLTTIGTYFRCNMYYSCTKLTSAAVEVPFVNTVNILAYYRVNQYRNCPQLVSIGSYTSSYSVPVAEPTGTVVATQYRYYQFYGCSKFPCSILVLESNFGDILNSSTDAYQYMYYLSSARTTADTISHYKKITEGYQLVITIMNPISYLIPTTGVYAIRVYWNNPQVWVQYSGIELNEGDGLVTTTSYGSSGVFAQIEGAVFGYRVVNASADTYERYEYISDSTLDFTVTEGTYTTEANRYVEVYRLGEVTTTSPVTDFTPQADKNFVYNRTGITGYSSLHSYWK